MLKAGFGIDMSDPYWNERKEVPIPALGKSPRQLLQTLGTEWGRQLVAPNVWIVLAHDQYRARGPGMVITDVRFENEARWVRKNKGLVIHISRKDAAPVAAHSSEGGVIMADDDVIIYNDDSLEELQEKVNLLSVLQT